VLSAVILSVIMQCHSAKGPCAQCRSPESCNLECHYYTDSQYVESNSGKRHYAQFH
jgi:hypothetical protein